MKIWDFIDSSKEFINYTLEVDKYKVYHLNSNKNIFTINDDICFAIRGGEFKQEDVLNKEDFEVYESQVRVAKYMNSILEQ